MKSNNLLVGLMLLITTMHLDALSDVVFSSLDMSQITEDQVNHLSGAQIASLTATQIHALTPTRFKALIIRNIADGHCLRQLEHNQVLGMTKDQMDQLRDSDWNAFSYSNGIQTYLLRKGDISDEDFNRMDNNHKAALNLGLAGLTLPQLATITPEQIPFLTASQIQALTASQIQVLTASQIQVLTAAQIAALTAFQIQALTASQIQALTINYATCTPPNWSEAELALFAVCQDRCAQTGLCNTHGQISVLTPDQVTAFTVDQLRNFTAAQVAVVTSTQKAKLSTEQLAALAASRS